MGNPFVHIELQTDDPSKARAFFGELLDWSFEDMPMGDGSYTVIGVGEGTGGGLMKNPVAGAPAHWLAYVLVEDVAATAARVAGLGGTIIQDKTEIPGMGWFAVIADPTGAAVGLWQAAGEG